MGFHQFVYEYRASAGKWNVVKYHFYQGGIDRMRPQSYHQLISILVFAFLIGCSTNFTKSRKTTNVTSDTLFGPRQTPHYVIYYFDDTGIFESNTKTIDNLIFRYPFGTRGRQWKVSPDNTKIAFTYVDNDIGETTLSILELKDLKSWQIKKIPKNFHYSFAWSRDSKELAAGYASFTDNQSRVEYRLGVGDIFTASFLDRTIESIGCKVSKYVKKFLPNGILIVGDGNHLYGVNRQNCSTIFTMSTTGKRKITFSPDGTKIFYFKYVPISGTKRKMPELYLANYDGKNQKRIIGYKYDPRNASWSPDGTKIVCDVRSLEWTDVRHVSIYDLVTGKASFSIEEDSWGIPTSERAFWSPDGNKLVYDKTYELLNDRALFNPVYGNGSNTYLVQHKTVHHLRINLKEVILEASIHQNNLLTQSLGETVFWIDNQNILFGSAQGYKIFNLLRKSEYTFSSYKHPILIKQLAR